MRFEHVQQKSMLTSLKKRIFFFFIQVDGSLRKKTLAEENMNETNKNKYKKKHLVDYNIFGTMPQR